MKKSTNKRSFPESAGAPQLTSPEKRPASEQAAATAVVSVPFPSESFLDVEAAVSSAATSVVEGLTAKAIETEKIRTYNVAFHRCRPKGGGPRHHPIR